MSESLTLVDAFRCIAPVTVPPPELREHAASLLLSALARCGRSMRIDDALLEDARNQVLVTLVRSGPRGAMPEEPQSDDGVHAWLEVSVKRNAWKELRKAKAPSGERDDRGRPKWIPVESIDGLPAPHRTRSPIENAGRDTSPEDVHVELDLAMRASALVDSVARDLEADTRTVGGREVTVGEALDLLRALAEGDRTWDALAADWGVPRNTVEQGLGRMRLLLLRAVEESEAAQSDPWIQQAAREVISQRYVVIRKRSAVRD